MLNKSEESKIFVPYKALGYVCDKTPFCLKYNQRLKQYYVVAAISNSIHLYKCKGLRLVCVSKPLPSEIMCLAADNVFVYASCKSILYKVHLVRNIIKTFSGHKDDIIFILPFGSHVITVDQSSHIIVWEIETLEKYTEIQFDPKTFKVSAILHPHTYVNKILFGSTQGSLELWNIKSHKKIYTFEGWSSKVNALEQTSAIDVVGIGLENGQIKIHNLKFDQTIVTFQQEWGPVVALSFRTDGPTTFVSGSGNGCLVLWDLNEQKLITQIRDTHKVEGNILSISFIPLQPLLVTSSSDNSIKVWILDKGDDTANLLYIREGHQAPIYCLRYHGLNGENILTSGSDGSFRVFSLIHDGKNKVFALRCRDGKKLGRKKKRKLTEALNTNGMDDEDSMKSSAFSVGGHSILLPPIIHFASESSRQREWDDVLCCHRSFPYATTWSFYDSSVGKHLLRPPPFCTESKSKGNVDQLAGTTVCAITSCANFALVGYESGYVDKFNMQSGVWRGSFTEPPPCSKGITMASDIGPAHPSKSISLLQVDRFNKILVTGAGADRALKFWTLPSRKLYASLDLPECPTRANSLNRDSALLAVGLEDFTIAIIDILTRQLIRHLSGHESTLTDMVLKWDSRWLVSAGMDGCLKTWDIPSGSLIDVVRTEMPVVSLDLSPGQNLLATAHLGTRGVFLWSDRTAYSYVPLSEITERSADVQLLRSADPNSSKSEAERGLITLSDLPLTYARSVVYYDRVKARNLAGATTFKRESSDAIPFFIGHNVSEEKYFNSQMVPKRGQVLGSKILREQTDPEPIQENGGGESLISFGSRTDFGGKLLAYFRAKHDQSPISHVTLLQSELMETLSRFGPSAGNYELELLSPLNQGGSTTPLRAFISFLNQAFDSGTNYEIAQTYLNLVIKLHFQTIMESSELLAPFLELAELQSSSWNRLERDFLQCQSLISCLKNPFN